MCWVHCVSVYLYCLFLAFFYFFVWYLLQLQPYFSLLLLLLCAACMRDLASCVSQGQVVRVSQYRRGGPWCAGGRRSRHAALVSHCLVPLISLLPAVPFFRFALLVSLALNLFPTLLIFPSPLPPSHNFRLCFTCHLSGSTFSSQSSLLFHHVTIPPYPALNCLVMLLACLWWLGSWQAAHHLSSVTQSPSFFTSFSVFFYFVPYCSPYTVFYLFFSLSCCSSIFPLPSLLNFYPASCLPFTYGITSICPLVHMACLPVVISSINSQVNALFPFNVWLLPNILSGILLHPAYHTYK